MKHLLILLLTVISFQAFSQNWNPFPKNQTSHFKYEWKGKTYVDKFTVNTYTTDSAEYYFFNGNEKLLDECFQYATEEYGIPNWFWASTRNYSYDFLKTQGEYIEFYNLSYTDNGYTLPLFENPTVNAKQGIIIMPYCKLNDSWTTLRGVMKCTEQKVMDVLGVEDSVKVLSMEWSDDKILFSKTFGLIEIPHRFFLSKGWNRSSAVNLQLIGLKNEDQQIGYQQPQFEDYFTLKTGDKKYYKYYYRDGEWVGNEGKPVTVIEEITDVYKDEHVITYSITSTRYSNDGNPDEPGYITKTFKKNEIGRLLEGYPRGFDIIDYHMEDQLVNFDSLRIENVNGETVSYAWLRADGTRRFNVEGTCFITNWTADYYSQVLYSSKYGWMGHQNMQLVGGVIDGIKWGNTSIIINTDVDDLCLQNSLIFPNPVRNKLFIANYSKDFDRIEIKDVNGKTIWQQKFEQSIDVSFLSGGVYFIYLFEQDANVTSMRFMKSNN